jgi:hypothetical protein
MSASGSKISSTVLEMTAASPVLVASWKHLNAALLPVS